MSSTGSMYYGNVSSGQFLWNSNTNVVNSGKTIATFSANTPSSLEVAGDANFLGDVKIQGKSIVNLIENIENKLAIYCPDPEREEKWDELRELAIKYKELLAEIKEKEQVWKILKK